MNQVKQAIFDCDDVLAHLGQHVATEFTKILQRPVDIKDFTTFHLDELYEDELDVLEFFKNIELENLRPEVYASILTREMQAAGWKISVVTARGLIPDAQQRTEDWLQRNKIMVDQVIVVPYHGCKGDIIKDMGEIDFYVEDNGDHATAASKLDNVKDVYLMDKPWNQQYKVGTRIDSLYDVCKKVLT